MDSQMAYRIGDGVFGTPCNEWNFLNTVAATTRNMYVMPRTNYRLVSDIDIRITLSSASHHPSATTSSMLIKANVPFYFDTGINYAMGFISADGASTGNLWLTAMSPPAVGEIFDEGTDASLWTPTLAAENLTVNTSNFRSGSSSLSGDKNNSSEYYRIQKASVMDLRKWKHFACMFYVSSITNLSAVYFMLEKSNRTYAIYSAVNNVVVGWNLWLLNMDSPEYNGGISKSGIELMRFQINFSAAATTLSGILLDRCFAFGAV